ncbi:hypothetical protein BDN72DRAFT_966465 [Pluteus cervinus]|uniref:Uncharacterized protein n=1 Tax=Pluteus cervinus TaxID=181527 RepID=A0ACD2ZX47_9AGAR|nr:hypothetical protein BDN72DRAFT_966465 [Pluteus cervinus]
MEFLNEKRGVVWLSSCFIGMIFGAIHFLSWHSAFPTNPQLLLWRISSIVLVVEPFCLALEGIFDDIIDAGLSFETWKEGVASTLFLFLFPVSLLIGPLVYIFARMALLVLAFLTLRDPPPTAFQTISWTTYIPHL